MRLAVPPASSVPIFATAVPQSWKTAQGFLGLDRPRQIPLLFVLKGPARAGKKHVQNCLCIFVDGRGGGGWRLKMGTGPFKKCTPDNLLPANPRAMTKAHSPSPAWEIFGNCIRIRPSELLPGRNSHSTLHFSPPARPPRYFARVLGYARCIIALLEVLVYGWSNGRAKCPRFIPPCNDVYINQVERIRMGARSLF